MTFLKSRTIIVWGYAAVLTAALSGLLITGTATSPDALPVFGVLAVMGMLVATLSRLGAAVQGGTLSVWLGPSLFRQVYPLAAIAKVNVVKVEFPFAVGLRLLPDGWLYSLGGQDFTEVRLVGGRRVLIGFGEESGLPDALRRALRR